MAKKVVPIVTGESYHVYNRGVDKRKIFNERSDYLRFYQSMKFFNTVEPNLNYRLAKFRYSSHRKKNVEIAAYCLLPNHFHLILKQLRDGGISEFMKRLSAGYSGYYNEKYNRSGSLFQGVYKRVHIENDDQYKYLFAYVNENYFVHNLPINDLDVCHTSTFHYRGAKKSMLIDKDYKYDYKKSVLLARDIYKKRTIFKDCLE